MCQQIRKECKKTKEAIKASYQRVDKVDTLIRRTKMDAGEEARSRQYKGTAMSDDEESSCNSTRTRQK